MIRIPSAARLFLLCLALPVMGRAGDLNSILEKSNSPDGKFALLVKSIPDSLAAAIEPAGERPKPGEAVSLFLLQRKGHRVIREIDAAFRSDNTRNDESYSSYWSRGSDQFAAVYATPAGARIVAYQLSASGWARLPLPEFDWKAPLRAVAVQNNISSPEIGGTIGSITFKGGRIVVSMNARITGGDARDAELAYRYRLSGKTWVAELDSAALIKPSSAQ